EPGAATSLRVSGFSSSTTAGVPVTFTVTALDAFGNVATNYGGTVTFASGDTQAVLPGPFTFPPPGPRAHTCSATFLTAGPQTLTVAGTGVGNASGVATSVQVNAAAAVRLAISPPPASPYAQGTPFQVSVAATDPFGNTDPNFVGTVNLSV